MGLGVLLHQWKVVREIADSYQQAAVPGRREVMVKLQKAQAANTRYLLCEEAKKGEDCALGQR